MQTGTSLKGVRTTAGDFAQSQLSSIIDTPERNAKVVKGYLEYAEGRKAICFASGVEHAHNLAEQFGTAGIKSDCVIGKTPRDERKDKLNRFSIGEIDVLCNCGVLTEGYDEPSVSAILQTRPTKSSLLFTQMAGRGTRLFPGKKDCRIIDFCDDVAGHTLASTSSLLGLPADFDLDGKPAAKIREQIEELINPALKTEEEEKVEISDETGDGSTSSSEN